MSPAELRLCVLLLVRGAISANALSVTASRHCLAGHKSAPSDGCVWAWIGLRYDESSNVNSLAHKLCYSSERSCAAHLVKEH